MFSNITLPQAGHILPVVALFRYYSANFVSGLRTVLPNRPPKVCCAQCSSKHNTSVGGRNRFRPRLNK